MNKVDWSKAPEGAEFYACGSFWQRYGKFAHEYSESLNAFVNQGVFCAYLFSHDSYEPRPDHIVDANEKAWPENEERVDIIGTNGGDGMHYDEFREDAKAPVLKPTYNRDIVGLDGTKTTVDVYRVLDAFKTESAAIDHAVKKLLCAGIRHQKDRKQDLEEAIKSIQAELLLMSQR